MCGRFTLTISPEKLRQFFPLFDLPQDAPPRYNIAPTQEVLAVRQVEGQDRPQGAFLHWGLVPSWAEDISVGPRLINARADSVPTKPAFRTAFKKRRCLILADGFFEWQKQGKKKQPFHFRRVDGAPFAFAGLWEFWKMGDDEPVESCTIITTDANQAVRPLHDRMPVILEPRDLPGWLDATADPQRLQEMLRPAHDDLITAVPVNALVNNARVDSPECLLPPPPASEHQMKLW